MRSGYGRQHPIRDIQIATTSAAPRRENTFLEIPPPPSATTAMASVSYPEQLRMADESAIGKYIQYNAGPLAGRCVRSLSLQTSSFSKPVLLTLWGQTRSELQAYQKPDLGRKYAGLTTFAPQTPHAFLKYSLDEKDSQNGIVDLWIHHLSSGYECLNSWMLVYTLSMSSRFPLGMFL